MASVYLLTPALQRYDWGTTTDIPALLGVEPDGAPVAEAWWGAHPGAPATASVEGALVPLTTVIAADAVAALGDQVAREWDGRLPYLLKVLAIEKPLSIQVHPSVEQAQLGFAREEASGIALDARERTFKDRSHKPEMVVALTRMVLLAGFRPLADLVADLARIDHDDARQLRALLTDRAGDALPLESYLFTALTFDDASGVLASLANAAREPDASPELHCAGDALAAHPGDAGALVALAMNAVVLEPGQANFTGAGIVHSYLSGVGLEVMANSDNVVRAGLTSKPVNLELLRELAILEPSEPSLPIPVGITASHAFVTPATEYALTLVRDGVATVEPGPRTVLVLDGDATIDAGASAMSLAQGQSAFVPWSDGAATVTAHGLTAVASVPERR